jgi:hypothetical protein
MLIMIEQFIFLSRARAWQTFACLLMLSLICGTGTLGAQAEEENQPAAPAPALDAEKEKKARKKPREKKGEFNDTVSPITRPGFEGWPTPPPPIVTPAPAPAAPSPEEVERAALAKAAGERRLFGFHAENLDLKAALAVFARANELNIVPDNDVTGTVTLDVRDLPLHQMMRALLEASDCAWQEEGGLIRVRNTETRMFNIDYLRLSRQGKGESKATLGSGAVGGAGGGGGGGGAPESSKPPKFCAQ